MLCVYMGILCENKLSYINNLREKISPGPGIEPGSLALRAGAITTKPPRRYTGPSRNSSLIESPLPSGSTSASTYNCCALKNLQFRFQEKHLNLNRASDQEIRGFCVLSLKIVSQSFTWDPRSLLSLGRNSNNNFVG